jgi:hypothetical protein
VHTADNGWVWVPDDAWGPGWVDGRYSEGYVGWAPMPPEGEWRNSALVTARADLGAPKYEGYWVFVSEHSFARGEVRDQRLAAADMRLKLRASQRVASYSIVKGRAHGLLSGNPRHTAECAGGRFRPMSGWAVREAASSPQDEASNRELTRQTVCRFVSAP